MGKRTARFGGPLLFHDLYVDITVASTYVVVSGVSEAGFVSGECDGIAADHDLDFCKRSDFLAELHKPGRGVRAVTHKRVFDPPRCPDLDDQ